MMLVVKGLFIFSINIICMARTYTVNNQTRTLAEWAKIINVPVQALHLRIYRRNWPVELALTTPKGAIRITRSVEDRFWEKVDPFDRLDPDGCWRWVGATQDFGYGWFSAVPRKPEGTHRFSYKLHTGPIPDGECVCHTCDNPPCVNPRHLFLGSRDVNNKDMGKKGRGRNGFSGITHCTRGHAYTPDNTLVYGSHRQCKTCNHLRYLARGAK